VDRGGHGRRRPGRVVQLDPIKPELKPPGTERLKLMCDTLVSTFAFKFRLRRYIQGLAQATNIVFSNGALDPW